jgi:RNA polymerase sigma factor (sigma-70 family)
LNSGLPHSCARKENKNFKRIRLSIACEPNRKIYAGQIKFGTELENQLVCAAIPLHLKSTNTHSGHRSAPGQVRDDFLLEPPDKVHGPAKNRGISDRSPDLIFIKQVLDGDESAARTLQACYSARLKASLCKRGASRTEAEDLLADLWADCFGSSGEPLLLKYEGRCPLSSWLITVVTNRLIDFKRREAFRRELPCEKSVKCQANDLQPSGYFLARQLDNTLVALLRQAILNAFAAVPQEMLLMLRLVHIYEITQREIGQMWNWHESKVSRTLESARTKMRTAILAELHQADPWLTLEWDDLVELAACAPELVSRGRSENWDAR